MGEFSLQGVYEYGGMTYELVSHPSGASFEACSKLVKMVLRQSLECGAPQARFTAEVFQPVSANKNLFLCWSNHCATSMANMRLGESFSTTELP